ncbi:MAG: stage III sporulation protein AG [Bacillota bacterium]|nr:stage III sporulation protein AG [Bacillota bacterium]
MFNLKDDFVKWWEQAKGRKDWPGLGSPQLWRLLLLLGAGIFLLVYAGSWIHPQNTPARESSPPQKEEIVSEAGLAAAEKDLERRLEEILSAVAGAGQVQVTVTLAAGPEHVYAKNTSQEKRTIEEKDQAGGTRTTTEINEQGNLVLVQQVSGGKEEPVVIKATRPEIAGILVLAEGARNADLREKLVHAVVTVLAVPPHKVTVLPKESW